MLLVAGILSSAADYAFHLVPLPMDGTFHLFNPMRRIALGQSGGVDYQNYHGIVLPYLYYPAFKAGHFTLFALELTRNLYTAVAMILGYVAMFAVLTRSASRTMRLSTIALIASLAFTLYNILTPGASEFGVRTIFPVLFAAMLGLHTEQRTFRLRGLFEGMLLGLFVAISTEQGVALVVAYVVVMGLLIVRSSERAAETMRLVAVLCVGAVTFALTLMMIGGPYGMLAALHYNFGDVSKDQFWYFGALPSAFLWMWRQLLEFPWLPLVLVLALVNAAWCLQPILRRRPIRPMRATSLAVLAIYGVLSATPVLARWVTGYTDNAVRIMLIVGLYALDTAVMVRARNARRAGTPVPGAARNWAAIAVGLALAGALLRAPGLSARIVSAAPHVLNVHLVHGEAADLSPEWKETLRGANEILDRHRRPNQPPSLWSTYTTLVDATNGAMNPAFDYIIDALGPKNRAAYLAAFRQMQPEVVQTINPRYTTFEEWLDVTSWDFYREVLTNYKVSGTGPWSVFWERLPAPAAVESLLVKWDQPMGGRSPIAIFSMGPSRGVNVLDVDVGYHTSNPWEKVPLIGQMPRFVVLIGGALNTLPVPLAPYATHTSFPVVINNNANGGKLAISVMVQSLLPGARIVLDSVRVRGMSVTAEQQPWLQLFAAEALTPRR